MARKIARIDSDAMNSLYASELNKAGIKSAAADDKGGPHAPQAFQDHEEYLEILKSVMSDDKKTDGDPNSALID